MLFSLTGESDGNPLHLSLIVANSWRYVIVEDVRSVRQSLMMKAYIGGSEYTNLPI